MATYIYKCADCGNIFGVKATIQEKEESKNEKFICPKCRSKNIKQKFSAGCFIKNIFKSSDACGCCSGENAGGARGKPKEKCGCGNKNSGNGCCG